MRVLVLNNRHDADAWVDQQLEELRALFPPAVTVVASRDDFRANIPNLGSFETWIQDVVHGIEYGTFRPRFDAFIIGDLELGKANAGIVREALMVGKTVLYINRGEGQAVTGVREVDPRNYTSGWLAMVTP